MSTPKLYDYWRSSASYRVRIVLNLADIEYNAFSINLLEGEHRAEVHRTRHPQGLVPALEIDGHLFTQSLAIIEYLNEAHNLSLLQDDTALRTKIRALAQTLAVDVHPICNLSVAKFATEVSGSEDTRLLWMKRFIEPGLQAFETMLADFNQTPFATGNSVSLADVCLIPQIYNALRWEADFSGCTRIQSVLKACELHSAFKKAHPDAVKPNRTPYGCP